jgi:hypothetical protein
MFKQCGEPAREPGGGGAVDDGMINRDGDVH